MKHNSQNNIILKRIKKKKKKNEYLKGEKNTIPN
jgi:hypothetical protein